jgi:hypothetical protein
MTTETDLRARALDAALDLFSTRGIAGDQLCATSPGQPGSRRPCCITYFGSKPQLVETLIAERLMPVVAQMRESDAAARRRKRGTDRRIRSAPHTA